MITVLAQIMELGTPAILLVLIGLVSWLIAMQSAVKKEIEKNAIEDVTRSALLKETLSAAISASATCIEARAKERFDRFGDEVEEVKQRIASIERDYLPREEHWKDISGWRTEIMELRKFLVDAIQRKGKDDK